MIQRLFGGRKPKPKKREHEMTEREALVKLALSMKDMAEKAHEKLMLRSDEQLEVMRAEREIEFLKLRTAELDNGKAPTKQNPQYQPVTSANGRMSNDDESVFNIDSLEN